MSSKFDKIKIFGITNQIAELDLDRIEKRFDVDLGRKKSKATKDNIYYPQFDLVVRKEAREMAKHYEIFYCLEKSIRSLISTTLLSAFGEDWWKLKVPELLQKEVEKRIKKDVDSAFTLRSQDPIDFTNFGELGEIIKTNWSSFPIFNSIRAVEKVLSSLNTLRGPIAHCSSLAEDEALRLQISVRDWFRLME